MNAPAWALLALAAAFVAGNWWAVERDHRRLEWVCKPATMVALLGVALSVDLAAGDGARRHWFVAAVLLSLAGDVFLMLPKERFVAGLASFLLAHLAYIGGLLADPGPPGLYVIAAVVVAVVVVLVGRSVLRGVRQGDDPGLLPPVSVYMAVISVMVVTAVGTGMVLAAAGAVLFFASDALIAWSRFVRSFPHQRLAIMTTYHLGQAGLVLSLTTS